MVMMMKMERNDQIHFEAVEVLASDLKVEAWVLPKAKLQTNYFRSTISGSFVVWHGSGEARVCFVPQSHREGLFFFFFFSDPDQLFN